MVDAASRSAGPSDGDPTRSLADRTRLFLTDRSSSGVAQRFAGLAYLFRVANAGIAFLTQILLARWMGAHEFGIYIYVWTWVVCSAP